MARNLSTDRRVMIQLAQFPFQNTKNLQIIQEIKNVLKKFFGGHKSFFGWPVHHWFGFLVMSSLGFKARVSSLIRVWQRLMRSLLKLKGLYHIKQSKS